MGMIQTHFRIDVCHTIMQYLVKPDGTTQSFSGVEPMELVPHISKAMGIDDEEANSEF